jgi:hypothetical protein
MIRQTLWSVAILASSGLLLALVQTGSGSTVRTLVAVWCLLVCPGMSYIQSLRIKHTFIRWTLAIALSISIDTLVALAILYGGIWDYKLGMFVILAITWTGVGVAIIRAWKSWQDKSPPQQSKVVP